MWDEQSFNLSTLVALMTKYPRKIYWLPFIGWRLKRIDQSIKKYGLQEGWKRGLRGIRIKTHSPLSPQTVQTLQKKPVILIGNHPHQLEWPAILAASPKRKNSYFVGMAEVANIWPSLKKHSLKTYNIRNNWVDKIMVNIIGYLNNTKKMTKSESKAYNQAIIKKAAEKLQNGGLITFFPGPHCKQKDSWKPGLGYLISKALNGNKKIYLVNSYVKGSSTFDFLCFLPLLGKLLPTLNVFFSKPVLLTILPGETPREIVARYQQNYWQWVDREVLI